MRISDWSSDVCSSDLGDLGALLVEHVDSRLAAGAEHDAAAASARCLVLQHPESRQTGRGCRAHEAAAFAMRARLGRSEERREGKSVSVRVDLGGRRIIRKKNKRL